MWYTFSDGLIRVFTKEANRTANKDILQAFEEELSATSLNAQLELGGIKTSEYVSRNKFPFRKSI